MVGKRATFTSRFMNKPFSSTWIDQGNRLAADNDRMPTARASAFSIRRDYRPESVMKTWFDDKTGRLETKLTEIVVEVVLTAESEYRLGAIRQHEWRIQRKAQLEEEGRQRKIEAERAEIERQARLAQARIDRLMKDADAFQRASEIRRYVGKVRVASSCGGPIETEELETWMTWALAQADRIDPSVDQKFLASMHDEQE